MKSPIVRFFHDFYFSFWTFYFDKFFADWEGLIKG